MNKPPTHKNDACIEVAVPVPVFNTYTYAVPEPMLSLIEPGKRVIVPFGKQRITGYIMGPALPPLPEKIKPVLDIMDESPLFPAAMIPLFQWAAEYYIHPIGEIIKEALPGGINTGESVTLAITEKGLQSLKTDVPSSTEKKIFDLLQTGPCRLKDLHKNLGLEAASVYRMEQKKWIERKREIRKGAIRPKMERFIALVEGNSPSNQVSEAQQKILAYASGKTAVPVSELRHIVSNPSAPIKTLEKKGYISVFEKQVFRDPLGEPVPPDTLLKLNLEQKVAVSEVLKRIGGGFATFLLAGVTGSGKTEVYMHLSAAVLQNSRTVLVLVPEIALITEIERRFRARFGECVAVLHSGLSSGERYDQWLRVIQRKASIVIGARSAGFPPLTDLGLIIVDEEHDTSYKQEDRFRYNARDLAIVRAKQENGIALLGSATPSVQSVYNVAHRKFYELNLKQRIYKQKMPEIQVIDLKKLKDFKGIWRFITPTLHQAMRQTLERKEQVLLFLNRRGFASYPVCANCGQPLKCKNCDITLTLHQKANAYKCHLCGYTQPASCRCETCGSSAIKRLGLGTEKIEDAVKKLFPEARVARMDRDTVTRRGALVEILKGLRNHEIDILIGTQMVAKGHDFPNITLVGVICADLSLDFPDFRADELTFQLIAQVAGRAGRGTLPGRVILQTYNPDHFSITTARQQDFIAFYNQEIVFRKTFRYPPFSRMILFKISGRDMKKTEKYARLLGRRCAGLKSKDPRFQKEIEILGPIEAPLARIANRYRWQILIKSPGVEPLHGFARSLIQQSKASDKDIRLGIDVDPLFMM